MPQRNKSEKQVKRTRDALRQLMGSEEEVDQEQQNTDVQPDADAHELSHTADTEQEHTPTDDEQATPDIEYSHTDAEQSEHTAHSTYTPAHQQEYAATQEKETIGAQGEAKLSLDNKSSEEEATPEYPHVPADEHVHPDTAPQKHAANAHQESAAAQHHDHTPTDQQQPATSLHHKHALVHHQEHTRTHHREHALTPESEELKLPKPRPKDKTRFQPTITEEHDAYLTRLAKRNEVSKSELVRHMIAWYGAYGPLSGREAPPEEFVELPHERGLEAEARTPRGRTSKLIRPQLLITKEMKSNLTRLAEESSISVSELLRHIVSWYRLYGPISD